MEEKTLDSPNIQEDIKYNIKGEGDLQICILSLLHGNEFSGLQVNNQVMDLIEPGKQAKVISFPIMNPDGFLKNQREHSEYGDLDRNPLSKVSNNKSVSYIEHIYNKYLSKSDLIFDLHSWNELSSRFIILNKINKAKVETDKAESIRNIMLETSKEIGLPLIEQSHTNRNYLCETLINKAAVPSIKVELGDHIIDNDQEIQKISKGIINSINSFIKNPQPIAGDNFAKKNEYYKKRYLKAPVKGKIKRIAKPGDKLQKGEKVFSVIRNNREIFKKAPKDGWVATYETKKRFDRVCMYATKQERDNLIY